MANWALEGSAFANDVEETIDLPSSHATRSHAHLDPLGIPIVEEFVVSSSIKNDLSRRKSGESSAQSSPGLLYISLSDWSELKGNVRSSCQDCSGDP